MAPEDMSGRFDLFGLIIGYDTVVRPLLFAMAVLIGMVIHKSRLIGIQLYAYLTFIVTLVAMSELSDIQPHVPLPFSFRILAIFSALGLPVAAFGYFIARLARSRRRAVSFTETGRKISND